LVTMAALYLYSLTNKI